MDSKSYGLPISPTMTAYVKSLDSNLEYVSCCWQPKVTKVSGETVLVLPAQDCGFRVEGHGHMRRKPSTLLCNTLRAGHFTLVPEKVS